MSTASIQFISLRTISSILFLSIFSFSAKSQTSSSLLFDGVNDQVNISNTGVFDLATVTVEAWVKPGAYNANKVFLALRTNTAGGTRWSAHLNQVAGTIGIWNGSTFGTVSYPMLAGTWYHIAMVITTTNTSVYVNGIAVGNTGNGMNAASTLRPLTIGSPNDSGVPGEWFTGEIDEVLVWNTSLTQAQIKETIYKTTAPDASGLLAYYTFSEGAGPSLANSSVNTPGVNGTLANGPVWTDSPIRYAGNALSLDGTNDYATIPWSATHDISTTLSVEAWVYPVTSNWSNILMKGNYGYGLALSGLGGSGTCGTTGNLVFWDQSQCGTTIRSALSYTMNTWQHVAVTVEDIGSQLQIYFYVNGVQDGPYLSNATAIDNGGVNKLIYLGTQGECLCNNFSGNIDEVRIWNEIRTLSQVQSGMNNELDPALQTNLIAYYTFNQGFAAGTNTGLRTVIDRRGINNATLVNFALNGSSSNYVQQNTGLFLLPLQWLSFTAQKINGQVLLNWSTASELNTKDFTIQHSVNGTEWADIGKVSAVGNSDTNNDYNFIHATPATTINYYRILQTDLDGKSSYSGIRSVKFSASVESFRVIGNPVTNGQIQVQVNTADVLSLYDSYGNLRWTKKVAPGMHAFAINGYAKGLYFLKAGIQLEKIAVQ